MIKWFDTKQQDKNYIITIYDTNITLTYEKTSGCGSSISNDVVCILFVAVITACVMVVLRKRNAKR